MIDALNVEMTAGSTVWILAGSLILGCACSNFRPCLSTNILCTRRRSEDRLHFIRRVVKRRIREGGPESSAESSEGDFRTSPSPGSEIPPFKTNRRTHASHRPRNKVRIWSFLFIESLRLIYSKRYHVYSAVRSFPHCPYRVGNFHGLRHSCE